MSYSVSFAGKPEEVVQKLQNYSTIIDGVAKKEYDAALPYLVGLVSQNSGDPNRQVIIGAFGGTHINGEITSQTCSVTLQEHDPLV